MDLGVRDLTDVHGTLFFFFNDTATTEIYTLSLHDALPISLPPLWRRKNARMISSRLTLSELPVVRFACSLGTAAYRLQDAVWCQAQVVYCKPLEKPRFAVGLEIFTRVKRFAKQPRQ